jgi:PAS domain-containing protein
MIASSNQIITNVNKAFVTVTGYSFSEAVGQKTTLLQSGKQDAPFYVQLWETIDLLRQNK